LAFQHLEIPEVPFILDIDLDFWAPEMGNQSFSSLDKLHQLMQKAECITIATSPYFLEQERAVELVKKLIC
jgi:hypothetical protein